jgi:hypothetical protein
LITSRIHDERTALPRPIPSISKNNLDFRTLWWLNNFTFRLAAGRQMSNDPVCVMNC